MTEFLETVRGTVEKHRMFQSGGRVLVGVSGGPDSTALLSALVALRKQFSLDLHAGYLDHGLRPNAIGKEITLVKRLGRFWGVPVAILRRKVRKRPGESLETSARETRYEGLIGLAHRTGCRIIALGHTADDQAETVLMWLLRGTGTIGLAGIPPVRVFEDSPVRGRSAAQGVPGRAVPSTCALRIVRPLIACSRRQIEDYLKGQGIRPCRDETNRSVRFLRNRIRHRLIPLLEREYSPQVRRRLSALAEIFREDLTWTRDEAAGRFRQVARRRGPGFLLNRRRLKDFPTALRRRILQLAVEKLQGDRQGFEIRHWTLLDRLLMNGVFKAADLPHGLRVEATGGPWISLERCQAPNREKSGWRKEKSGTLKK